MKLRSEIEKPHLGFKIDHHTQGLSLGSCFAENIAMRLQKLRFNLCSNPFGTLYNPASIAGCIKRLAEGREFVQDELFYFNHLWHSSLHHGDFSDCQPDTTLEKINNSLRQGSLALKTSNYLIITLGTAWVYESIETGAIVGNCHKQASCKFSRSRLSVEQIVDMLSELIDNHLQDKHIILSVSPIRHLKDGLQENSLSKATLILASHTLAQKYPTKVNYFPAYECLVDDLRDYRFYNSDLVHPSQMAIDYIWELFSQSAFSAESKELNQQIASIAQGLEHRPINPSSPSHKLFCQSMIAKIKALKQQHPNLEFESWLEHFAG